MRRRSRPGGKPIKARRRKAIRLKRHSAAKAVRSRGSSATGQRIKIARLTHKLQTSEERWQSLLENPIFGVTFLDEHQRFISTNQAFRTLTGYSEEELRQMTPLDMSVPGERELNEILSSTMRCGWPNC